MGGVTHLSLSAPLVEHPEQAPDGPAAHPRRPARPAPRARPRARGSTSWSDPTAETANSAGRSGRPGRRSRPGHRRQQLALPGREVRHVQARARSGRAGTPARWRRAGSPAAPAPCRRRTGPPSSPAPAAAAAATPASARPAGPASPASTYVGSRTATVAPSRRRDQVATAIVSANAGTMINDVAGEEAGQPGQRRQVPGAVQQYGEQEAGRAAPASRVAGFGGPGRDAQPDADHRA